ncbi:MAG: hypothetical protein U9O89_08230 [Thermoproteota archaeon]|nr:hypothetical protein [Thermoproteota archaeon]
MKKWIFVAAVLIIIVVAAVSLLSRTTEEPKEAAEEYFDVSVVDYFGLNYDSQLGLMEVVLTIKPILGNATETYITQVEGMTENQDLGTILEGTNKTVDIIFEKKVLLHPSGKGYALSFYLTCHEAHGKMTVYLQPK